MGKQIEVTFPNREVWKLDAQIVAEDRARYYAGDDNEVAYQEAIDYVLSPAGEMELLDYLQYRMDWQAVQALARKVSAANPCDYALMFDDARFEVKAGEG